MSALPAADLMQFSVPYPVLLAEYQDRVGVLTNENVMLRATIAHMQRTATAQTAALAGLSTADVLPQSAGSEG
ncbi:MAG TPA: hypothetical protein VGS97_18515 [Actinocrinis sp.]|uniref:hypothetical protein n=1 Tax=Actinocrinis sp. TaxID=1920516 RepID=UPI002DDD2217|nr:hypothetical protein [Actinocrinis sp.]HEV2346100.1 hypothetical protein [Actinocrinis sp.]